MSLRGSHLLLLQGFLQVKMAIINVTKMLIMVTILILGIWEYDGENVQEELPERKIASVQGRRQEEGKSRRM